MYIQRKKEKEIEKYLKTKEILALIGPRQAGKTTLLKKIFNDLLIKKPEKKASFITFEDRDILSLFNSDIKNFAETYIQGNDFLFIDEFQYARQGGKNLKYLFDTFDIKIIISGSSAIDLTIETLKYLVGRVFILELQPFDFEEFLLAKDKNYYRLYLKNKIDFNIFSQNSLALTQLKTFRKYFEEYALWGGYPRVVLAKGKSEKEMILKNIYNTYFLREVKTLMDITDDYKLEKLIKMLALQIGNMVDFDGLSNETDISFQTIKKYLNFLEKTYITKLIKPFFKSKRREIVKAPKIFFFDNGLRNVIVNDFRRLDERTDAGELLENAVWMQFRRQELEIKYWRDKNKNEIDFILTLPENKAVAIEVKKNLNKCKNISTAFSKAYPEINKYCAFLKENKKNTVLENSVFIPLI